MKYPGVLYRYRDMVAERLKVLIPENPVYDMLSYHLGFKDEEGKRVSGFFGKALRGSLLLLVSDILGGSVEEALPYALFVELVHNFSLIHDDIEDGDRERRGRPAVWSIWGVGKGIIAGDITFSLASKLGLGKNLEAYGAVEESSLRMIEGQAMDIAFEEREKISIPEYMDMVRKKTGALFGASLSVGAILSGFDGFYELGERMGVLFQMRDDFLGIWGEPGETGKPRGGDILKRKKTLPIVYAMDVHKDFPEIYRRGDFEEIMDVLERVGAREFTEEECGRVKGEALALLSSLEAPPSLKGALSEIIEFFAHRRS